MGLIKCPKCGAEISDQAKHCTKCGCLLESNGKKPPTTMVKVIAVICGIIGFLVLISGFGDFLHAFS